MSLAEPITVQEEERSVPALVAVRNAFKLGSSLVFTWGIALAVRLMLPRYLGPTLYGTLSFAEAFTITSFIFLNLGAETYIRKEVAVRPAHASDFFGGVVVARVVLTGAIFAAMALILQVAHRSDVERRLVYVYGLTQFFVVANATLSALLHAKGRVGGMSILAVATKVVWGAGIALGMATRAGLWVFAVAYLASESVESVVLYRLAQRHLGLTFRLDWRATRAMLLSSLAYYLQVFASTAYGKLDVTLLGIESTGREVGYYSAAGAIAGLTLLITPLIGWVLMPMFARAAAESRDELFSQVRRTLELILSLAIPASLAITLGADTWIRLIFGAAYAPAAPALRVLAVMFVLMYVGIVCACTLVMLERAWTLTLICCAGLVVNAALNLSLIRLSIRLFGEGGGGTGCALAMLGTEAIVTTSMLSAVGRGAFDRRSVTAVLKALGACGAVAAAHVLLRGLGEWRIAVDLSLYVALAVASGAIRPAELLRVGRQALRQRESGRAA